MLAEARVLVEEVLREARALSPALEEDPYDLEEVESRLHRLERLMLKHGGSVEEVLARRAALVEERADLLAVEDRLGAAVGAAAEALAAYDGLAVKLHRERISAAAALMVSMTSVLEQLEMAGTRLDFRWQARPDPASPLHRDGIAVAFGEEGVEEGELLLAANRGEELRPMARIASGGELSRIHLAIRSVLRQRGPRGGVTLLFDEVDSGLGGRAAAALAGLLTDLAGRDQILVVTHLPQVAGRAENQVMVDKAVVDGRTVTRAVSLDAEQRVREVARMIAGDELTESALRHARELLAG
jgi:DNA repair protein RecN (Recombination protein N)